MPEHKVPAKVLMSLREYVNDTVGISLAEDRVKALRKMGIDTSIDPKLPWLLLGNKIKVRLQVFDGMLVEGNVEKPNPLLLDMFDLVPALFLYCFGRELELKQEDALERRKEMREAFDKEALAMLGGSIHSRN